MSPDLLDLGVQIALSAVMAFGGLTSVVTELNHDLVRHMGLLTSDQFTQAYALATAAPGPAGPILLSLLGMEAAGLPGALVALAAWTVPTTLLMYLIGRSSRRMDLPWVKRLFSVLRACAVGLVFSGVLRLADSFDFSVAREGYVELAVAVVAVVLLERFKAVRPLHVLAGCMLLGALVF